MNALEELTQISGQLQNSYVSDWKAQGKKVVGYVCSYVPEEILVAADILPFRITGLGVSDTSEADAYLSRVNCSFARCCLEAGFKGAYDFLDGAVWVNGCDHIRRCYDNWKAKIPFDFMHMLPVPHKIFPDGRQWYKEEVQGMMEAVEKHFDVKITDDRLLAASLVYNETRKILKQLYEMRARPEPVFTGAEVITILSAGVRIPKTEFNRLLSQVLQEAEQASKKANGHVRLLVGGSMMDDIDFIQNIESMGGIVVADSLCMGARSFWNLTEESGAILENLVDRYYAHASCPRMAGEYKNRFDFTMDRIQEADVKGVILENIKFCDLHGTENALIKKDLEKEGIPVIELERQYGPLADAGRLKTRVQAFLERLDR